MLAFAARACDSAMANTESMRLARFLISSAYRAALLEAHDDQLAQTVVITARDIAIELLIERGRTRGAAVDCLNDELAQALVDGIKSSRHERQEPPDE